MNWRAANLEYLKIKFCHFPAGRGAEENVENIGVHSILVKTPAGYLRNRSRAALSIQQGHRAFLTEIFIGKLPKCLSTGSGCVLTNPSLFSITLYHRDTVNLVINLLPIEITLKFVK
jgi:hypothetical protein